MYLVLNNKIYLDINKLKDYLNGLDKIDIENTNLVVAPSFPLIPFFRNKKFKLSSQDVSNKLSGSYTAEVPAPYLKALDVEYSIVNHYERYTYYKEEMDEIIEKINNLNKYKIIPILCITTDINEDKSIIDKIDYILKKIDINKEIIIAYESKKAIEEDKIDDYDLLKSKIIEIKNHINNEYNIDIPIIYGGCVNRDTIKELIKIDCLDGFIMGKKSINIDEVNKVIEVINNG